MDLAYCKNIPEYEYLLILGEHLPVLRVTILLPKIRSLERSGVWPISFLYGVDLCSNAACGSLFFFFFDKTQHVRGHYSQNGHGH